MTFKGQWYRDKLAKKRQKGFRGYPVATVAYYGHDDRRASKVSVGVPMERRQEVRRPISNTTVSTGVLAAGIRPPMVSR